MQGLDQVHTVEVVGSRPASPTGKDESDDDLAGEQVVDVVVDAPVGAVAAIHAVVAPVPSRMLARQLSRA
jgi:hypothetical protein